MRAGGVASSLRSVVEGLTSSARRVWWTSFLVVTMLAGMWALASPPFAGPDEPAHVIRAYAVDHGQLTGDEPSARVTKELRRIGEGRHLLVVRAPAIYQSASGTLCFVFHPRVNASCLAFEGSTQDIDIPIYTARHPPAYYAVVGAVSWFLRPGAGADNL